MQLQPQEYFTIARGLEDHTDSATYYVRAVIRNARTDALIDTVNLTNQGDGYRFSREWQVPADTSGQGFYLLITSSVYTDSGYTTKASNYGDLYDTYLVQDRTRRIGGGWSGISVDYEKIKKIIIEEIQKLPRVDEIEFPKFEVPKFPEIPKVDLQPVMREIGAVKKLIDNLEFPVIPKPEKVDLQPLVNLIKKIDLSNTESNLAKLISYFDNLRVQLQGFAKTILEIEEYQKKCTILKLPEELYRPEEPQKVKMFKNLRA